MSFSVAAESYDRFMGRFSAPLALQFVQLVGDLRAPVLDVGAGTGALTRVLVDRLGEPAVHAVEPSAPFVAALHEAFPGVDVRLASAERLPFADDTFSASMAQLVVHFMADPVAGLREMARVTAPGGSVAACVWDHAGDSGPLSLFWAAVAELDPEAPAESALPGTADGQLAALMTEAGLRDVVQGRLVVRRDFESFDEWWQPFTLGVGPAGAYVATLDSADRAALAERCADMLPPAPFTVEAVAWSATGHV